MSGVLFFAFGYSFAYGNGCDDTANGFIGSSCYYFMEDDSVVGPSSYDGGFYAGWFFQWAFTATASTIVSGTVAERIVFKLYIIITAVLTTFIYPVVVHWGWSGDGWASAFAGDKRELLMGVGVVDFAGSGIVHLVGGVAAFVSAYMIGPRHGRYVKHYKMDGKKFAKSEDQPLLQDGAPIWMEIKVNDASATGEDWVGASKEDMAKLVGMSEEQLEALDYDWQANQFPCQSSTFQTFGCLILWFGWYGFNCASPLGISGGYSGIAAKVAVTTTLAAAGGALMSGALSYFVDGVQDLSAMSNGILAGLVSITAPCPAVEPWAAIVIGLIGGVIYYYGVKLLEKLLIDDVVLAIPVHCFCGIWGVLSVGFFASPQAMAVSYGSGGCGIFYSGHEGCTNAGDQLLAQILFVLAIIAWVSATMGLLLFVCKLILGASDETWQAQGGKPTSEHKTPLAYTRSMQMIGMDELKHGGMSGTETTTVYDQQPSEASTNTKNPTQGAVNPRKRRSSVVGQVVMAAPDASNP